jgi:serine/threonine-protein kinase RsbW
VSFDTFNTFNTYLDSPLFFSMRNCKFNDLPTAKFGMRVALTMSMTRHAQAEAEEAVHTHSLAVLGRPSTLGPFVELQQSMPSQVDAITPFVSQLMLFISKFRPTNGSELDIEIALREALVNAVIHGNRENPEKRVHVSCRCDTAGQVEIAVRDQGDGFDRNGIADPTSAQNVLNTHGRGIYLIQSLMDESWFEEGGTIVRMRKRANSNPAAQTRSK